MLPNRLAAASLIAGTVAWLYTFPPMITAVAMIPVPSVSPPPAAGVKIPARSAPVTVDARSAAWRAHLILNQATEADCTGKQRLAIRLYKEVLVFAHATGKPNIDGAIAAASLGSIYTQSGQIVPALKYCEMAVDEFTKVDGPSHNEVAIQLDNLGKLREQIKQPKQAEALYNRALSILNSAFDQDDELISNTELHLANLLSSERRYKEAAAHYQRSFEACKRFCGGASSDCYQSLSKLRAAQRKSR